jgi:hypothetical protein
MVFYFGVYLLAAILFKLQKKAVRIMTGHGNRTSCRDLFKKLEILPLKSQYIFYILLSVVKNKNCLLQIMIAIM